MVTLYLFAFATLPIDSSTLVTGVWAACWLVLAGTRETAAERWSLLAATGGAVATLSRSSVGLPLGTVATSVA